MSAEPIKETVSPEAIHILIVDDEKASRYGMVKALRPIGYQLTEAEDALSALTILGTSEIQVVITDIAMPNMDGIALLQKIKEDFPQIIVTVITAHGSERIAVEAMKAGAYDYVAKPYDIEELRAFVRNASREISLARENQWLLQELATVKGFGTFIGDSPAMRVVYQLTALRYENEVGSDRAPQRKV